MKARGIRRVKQTNTGNTVNLLCIKTAFKNYVTEIVTFTCDEWMQMGHERGGGYTAQYKSYIISRKSIATAQWYKNNIVWFIKKHILHKADWSG